MLEKDLTTDDVAVALQINKTTVQRLLHAGRLKGYQIGRSWRVPVEALRDFRSRASVKPMEPSAPAAGQLPIDPRTNYAEWEALLLREDGLASGGPAIPREALRRESMYEDRY